MKCEQCGQSVCVANSDYCAVCSKNLCDRCMNKGHCGNFPALSGLRIDHSEDGADEGTCTPKAS